MFTKPTVFILGAGASKHYDYPLGSELIDEIKKEAANFLNPLQKFKKISNDSITYTGHTPAFCPQYILDKCSKDNIEGAFSIEFSNTILECENIIKRLNEVDPLVIDYFLSHNEDLKNIGKLLIAAVIWKIEQKNKESNSVNGNWYKFILHQMMVGCETPEDFIKNNNVTFITFNYDTSLENHLKKDFHNMIFLKIPM